MGYSQTYKIDFGNTKNDEEVKLSTFDKIELKMKEIEEKIIALEGELLSPYQIDIYTYYHQNSQIRMSNDNTASGVNGLDNKYERCLFMHETDVDENYIVVAFNKHAEI